MFIYGSAYKVGVAKFDVNSYMVTVYDETRPSGAGGVNCCYIRTYDTVFT